MPPKPKDGVAAQAALNIRLTTDYLGLLDRLVEIEAKEVAARFGGDATYVDVTRASLVRKWILGAARERGLLAQTAFPFEQPPPVAVAPVVAPPPAVVVPVAAAPVAPPPAVVVPVDVAPVVAPPPAAEEAHVDVDQEVPVAAVAAEEAHVDVDQEVPVDVAPVVAPPPAEEAPPAAAPKRAKRKAPDAAAVRAALIAAAAKPGEQTRIGKLAKIDSGSLSKFKGDIRPLSAEKLADLAVVLTKAGHFAQ